MDLRFSAEDAAFRQRARTWLLTNLPSEPLPSGDTTAGFAAHKVFEQRLFADGWAVPSWPVEFGGQGASLVQWLIFEEEYWALGGPSRVAQNGIFLLAPAIFALGTDEQKARILKPMAAAEVLWAQGWSEPGAGSDLAAVKSYAERDEDAGGWRLFGQKTWCTRAAWCDRLFGLFRTDPNAAKKHHGLTYFLLDLDQPGIRLRPFARLDGDDGFAEVFLDGAFVADRDVLGEVNQGWRVAMQTTSSERGLSLRSPGRFLAASQRLAALWRERRDRPDVDPALRHDVTRALIDAQAYRWHTYRTATAMAAGKEIGAEASLSKLFWSEMDLQIHQTAMALLGEDADLDGAWGKGFQFALAGPIYAGTNEIQRNIVGRRVLGLPRGA
jgi:alkylation response protein AidB-like acyl-CoA dehydrogenase